MDMTGVYACLFEAVRDVTTVPNQKLVQIGQESARNQPQIVSKLITNSSKLNSKPNCQVVEKRSLAKELQSNHELLKKNTANRAVKHIKLVMVFQS